MNKYLATLFFSFVLAFNTTAQVQYETSNDPQNGLKTLKGILSVDVLKNDSAFAWMRNDISWYKPNAAAVTTLKEVKDTVQLLVFVGTWCEDSHNVIPKLFSLIDTAGFSGDRVTLIGVDRNKKTLSHLSEALNVTKVPTIIVLKGGKEYGRVIEFGKYGLFDMELGEILKTVD